MKKTPKLILAFIALIVGSFCFTISKAASPPTKHTAITIVHAYDATVAMSQASACAEQTITAKVNQHSWLSFEADFPPRVHPIYLAVYHASYSLPHPGQSGHYRYLNGIKVGLPYSRQL